MQSPSELSILVLGRLDSPEMEIVRKSLTLIRANVTLGSMNGTTIVEPSLFPDLIVVCQHWPDEFNSHQVHSLLTQYPLARLVCCYGPWCESDGRNRDIWPPGSRIPASGFERRLPLEIALLLDLRNATFLPLTASLTELFEHQFSDDTLVPLAGRFSVLSPDRAWKTMLESVLQTSGCQIAPAAEADVVLFDLDPGTAEQMATMSTLGDDPHCCVIALVGLLTSDVSDHAQRHGASAVAPKLLPFTSLYEIIVRSMEATA